MSAKPTVSIIIPTHNRPQLLPRAVESARAAGDNVEIVVVDDASCDSTSDVCKNLAGITYIRLERNQGVAGARNVGIVASSADKIAFLDDDDLRLPGSLKVQASRLNENPEAGMIFGGMLMANHDYQPTAEVAIGKPNGRDPFWELLELSFPVMPLGVMIRKECFQRVGLLNRHIPGIDDWDIFVRIAEVYPVKVMEEAVGIYRKPKPSSAQGSSSQSSQLIRALNHQPALFKLPRVRALPTRELRELRKRTVNRVADTLLMNALKQLPEKEYRFVYANVLTALRLNPLRVARPRAWLKLVSRGAEKN